MKEIFSILCLVLVTGVIPAHATTLTLDPSALHVDVERHVFTYGEWPEISIDQSGSFSAQHLLVELQSNESISDLQILSDNQIVIGELAVREDSPTDIEHQYVHDVIHGGQPSLATAGFVIGETEIVGRRCAEILLFPVSHADDGQVYFNESISISIGSRQISSDDLIPFGERLQQVRVAAGESENPAKYLIVTSRLLADALEPLKRYRLSTGFDAEIVSIEDILASRSGIDPAEKLREYLKQYYAQGGEYVLLAGDETVVPIRLAYHYTNHADTAISPVNLQLCDLYFADLTGNWDRDHDLTWGERIDDAADITPELKLGRLPFNRAEDFATYTQKLIHYETNPGEGDRSYLTRAFFYSSDQMRDLNGGQHNQIALAYPTNFSLDTVSGVEATRGDDPSPSNLAPADLGEVTSQGFGIVNIIAHGRSDGFVLKSANYNEWPKTIMLTEETAGHGSLDDMTAPGKPAFYYSLACDNTQFDCDQPYFGATAPNFSQALLADPDGAIAFVGHSRWGWVGTSYQLHQAFFDSLFAHPDRPAVEAMYGAKSALSFYRDMVYGLNYLGDPALHVYTAIPVTPSFSSDPDNPKAILVTANSQPVNGCQVTLSLADSLIEIATTDLAGRAVFTAALDPDFIYNVSISRQGLTVGRGYLSGSIATDVEDDPSSLPRQFALDQNYPNPFNPSTVISFALPTRAVVTLVVYNLLGQEVARPIDAELAAGTHSVSVDGTGLAAGVYLYRLNAGNYVETKKMVLLK